MTVPYRAEAVGSFLRPQYLMEAREQGVEGEALRELEDRAILEVLRMQEEIGLPVVTNGEFRRGHWPQLILQIADGVELIDGFPVPVAPIRQKASVVDTEFRILAEHTDHQIKITLPQPSALGMLWNEKHSSAAYETREEYIDDVTALLNQEARALAAAGVAYIQLDAPQYTVNPRNEHPAMLEADRRVFEDVEGVTTAVHLCRGNTRRPQDDPATPYDPYAQEVFGGFPVDRLLLEYDDYQAGDFTALQHVPDGVTVVLGLVTTKWPELEDEDEMIKRIEAATHYVPLERLALSPQCGFSSRATIQNVTPEIQRAKLELVVRVAERVWGTV